VIGGGNTAIDAARELALLGVPDVRVVYRRDTEAMPAYRHEREHALHEGVRFQHRVQPIAFEGNGRLEAVRVTTLDEKLRPVGGPFRLPADLAAVAIGQTRLEDRLGEIPGLAFEGGRLVVDPTTKRTPNPKYWAGGDLANGGAEVVNAAAEGKRAAHGIHAALQGARVG
jgi:glutamate synthase (NADPH/NADH) small chain